MRKILNFNNIKLSEKKLIAPYILDTAVNLEFAGYNDQQIKKEFGFSNVFELSYFIHQYRLCPKPFLVKSNKWQDKFLASDSIRLKIFEWFYFGLANSLLALVIFFTLWFTESGHILKPIEGLIIVLLSHIFASSWARILIVKFSFYNDRPIAGYGEKTINQYYLRGLFGIITAGIILFFLFSRDNIFTLVFIDISLFWLNIGYFVAFRQLPIYLITLGSILFLGSIYDPFVLFGVFNGVMIFYIWLKYLINLAREPFSVYSNSFSNNSLNLFSLFFFAINYGFLLLIDVIVLFFYGQFDTYDIFIHQYLAHKYFGIFPLLLSAGLIEAFGVYFFSKIIRLERVIKESTVMFNEIIKNYIQTISIFSMLHFGVTILVSFIIPLSNGYFKEVYISSTIGVMFLLLSLFNLNILHYLGWRKDLWFGIVSLFVGYVYGSLMFYNVAAYAVVYGFLMAGIVFFVTTMALLLKKALRYSYLVYLTSVLPKL